MRAKEELTLEAMPDTVKALYIKILAVQAVADNDLDPKEFSDLYLLMTQIGLSPAGREQVADFLLSSAHKCFSDLVKEVLSLSPYLSKEVVGFSLLKDLVRVSRVDRAITPEEMENIQTLAREIYHCDNNKIEETISYVVECMECDEMLLNGEMDERGFSRASDALNKKAVGLGISLEAVNFSGSIVGPDHMGERSLYKILGFSQASNSDAERVTGLSAIVALELAKHSSAARHTVGTKRPGKTKKPLPLSKAEMASEVAKLNQKTLEALIEDTKNLADKKNRLLSETKLSKAKEEKIVMLERLYSATFQVLGDREKAIKRLISQDV